MILFLDFDGVLHHSDVYVVSAEPSDLPSYAPKNPRYKTNDGKLIAGKNLFEHADRIAAALAPFPDIKIVITSTWREHFDLDQLKSFLPAGLADRVIGITPTELYVKGNGVSQRCREISAYYKLAGLPNRHWIALDDTDYLFGSAEHPNLVLCDGEIGFDDEVAAILVAKINVKQNINHIDR